ncbi:uncharacterized protein Z518_01494 [Rhinocladiella mackenziei CBS 650.93]|uniref:Uncharacterized protein n=1 Tax=Rhinocladiella mackenziei CBS 650.93 TaxID=1442369 RepID=A0A0D2G644_9EURO|nr:uncharacterized protein Z518_01494 [Rhinocladiella mackenziei CBS 650.93]KIX10412.1 hypothetical protein Z518_01494 [Rhinocladiella mackenziei CBS 650.93]
MNLLTRRTSNKSTGKESRGRVLGRSVSADRALQDEVKGSLFRRSRTRSSRSSERPDSKENDMPHELQGEAHAGQKPLAEDTGGKLPQQKVAEVSPEANSQNVKKEQTNADALSPVVTGSRDQLPTSGTTPEPPETTPGPVQGHDQKHHANGLTKDDVQHLFSGAPHFVLERGRRGRFFPQAFFPWNNSLDISDLQDRKHLRHESFALSTLHAHLPIPDEVSWKPGMEPPVKKEGLDTGKRPMFELGIFERPNMLAVEGREPGTVGMRYFLERPVADGLQDEKIKEHGKDVEIDLAIANAPAMEAFKMLAISKENEALNAKIGKHAPRQDRATLIRGGPQAWKCVGVRNISMKTLAERMEKICLWRDDVIHAGYKVTILNRMNSMELHAHLFGELLYPPRKLNTETKHEKAALKIQIEALVKVLTTPGAWLDLSMPEARLRFGKILHSRTTRYDHAAGSLDIDPERKWLLIQLLLAVELVIRLDAALRLGIAMHSDSFELGSDEIHHFNKLRNLKVDWDLVAARRFLFLSYVKKIEPKDPSPGHLSPPPRRVQLQQKSPAERHGFMGGLLHTLGLDEAKELQSIPDVCDLAILPRQPKVMIEGLVRFANNIGWPRSLEIQHSLHDKLCSTTAEVREKFLMDAITCSDDEVTGPSATKALVSITPPLPTLCVDLHPATPKSVGGWLSHSWMSGLIMPGFSICDILMSTLLENDTDPNTLKQLGTTAKPLRSAGFVLNGSSWWSKSSVFARVMAPMHGSKESMGWVYLPNFVPLYESTGKPLSTRWVKIKTFPVPSGRERPRIFDGDRLAIESTPLGMGKGGIMGSEFSMVTDHILDLQPGPDVWVKDIKVNLSFTDVTESNPDRPLSAWAQFELTTTESSASEPTTKQTQVRYGLDRAVYFVSAYPCRLPHGHATFKPGSTDAEYEQQHPRHKPAEHIPAHPLHKTYKFVTKTLSDLLNDPHDVEPSTGTTRGEVWVVDARQAVTHTPSQSDASSVLSNTTSTGTVTSTGTSTEECNSQLWEKDILVRAWCAQNGRNAIIARVGRTCLSCAIREAKALEIGVVVRVGVKE